MKKTLTQVEALSAMLAILDAFDEEYILLNGLQIDRVELATKIASMCDALTAKRDKPSKAELEKASEHEKLMTEIFNTLVELNKPSTISEVQTANTALAGYSTSKMSAMLKKLVDAGKVVRTVDKKKARFSAVPVK